VTSDKASAAAAREIDATRATARLPGLDIELVHRVLPDGAGEQVSVTLQAAPSFEAFGRALDAINPFAFWAQAVQLAWLPWIETARMLQAVGAPSRLPGPERKPLE
jgi:hypothetical protein